MMFGVPETDEKRAVGPRARRARKAPIRRRVNPLIPAKPKKVPTGYGLFIKAYWAHQNPSKPGNAAFLEKNSPPQGVTFDFTNLPVKKADPLTGHIPRVNLTFPAAAWNNLAESQKEAYQARAEPGQTEYMAQIAEWKDVKNEVKRPATAFAIFMKEIWAQGEQNGRSFSEMSKYASGLWNELSEDDKEKYKDHYRNNMKVYKLRVEFFRVNGRLPNEDELQVQMENADQDEVDNNGSEADADMETDDGEYDDVGESESEEEEEVDDEDDDDDE